MRDYQDIGSNLKVLRQFNSGELLRLISQMYPGDVCVIDEAFVFNHSCVLKVPDTAEASLRACEKRFAICNLHLYCVMHHANSLIFDRSSRSLTRFEPHGVRTIMTRGGKYALQPEEMVTKSGIVYDKIDIELEKWMRERVGDLFSTYYRVEKHVQYDGGKSAKGDVFSMEHREGSYPVDFSDLYGEGEKCAFKDFGGYCMTFSVLLLHLRIANPDKTVEEIVDHVASYGAKSLEETSKMYMNYMAFELAEPGSDSVPEPSCREVAEMLRRGRRTMYISKEGRARVGDVKIYFTDPEVYDSLVWILSVDDGGCKMDVEKMSGDKRRITLRFVVGPCARIAGAIKTAPPVHITLSDDSYSIPTLDMKGKLQYAYNHQNQTATILSVKPRCDKKRVVVKVLYADGHEGNVSLVVA